MKLTPEMNCFFLSCYATKNSLQILRHICRLLNIFSRKMLSAKIFAEIEIFGANSLTAAEF